MTDNSGRLVRGRLWFDGGFTMVPNTWVRDRRMSYGARGLLTFLASHDAAYQVTLRSLAAQSTQGLEGVRSHVGELERLGYLHRKQLRQRGQIRGYEWHLLDPFEPVDNSNRLPTFEDEPATPGEHGSAWSEPESGKPDTAEPDTAEPDTENPTLKKDQLQEETSPLQRQATEGDKCPNGHSIVIDGRWCAYACPPAEFELASDDDVAAALGRVNA